MRFKQLFTAALFLILSASLSLFAQEDSGTEETGDQTTEETGVPSDPQGTDPESEDTESADTESADTESGDESGGDASGVSLNMGIGLGATTIDGETWQTISMYPDLSFGKLGIGLGVDLRYRFVVSSSGNTEFAPRREDWVVDDGTFADWLNLYMAKIEYARWGHKGDPLYIKAGNLRSAVLGTGFTLGGYTNTLFLPDQRNFGMLLDIDGQLFDFPYLGIETVTGNLSQWDVLGARAYLRPLAGTDLPVIKALQVGISGYTDRKPFLYLTDEDDNNIYDGTGLSTDTKADPVSMAGTDLILPVINNPAATMRIFTDTVIQPEQSIGFMGGMDGTLIGFLLYGAQFRALGENFIPGYFGPNYDLERGVKYQIATSGKTLIEPYTGYQAMTGFSLLEGDLTTRITVDGPFNPDADADPTYKYPHLQGTVALAEDVIPSFFFDAHYDKYAIDSWESFTSFEDALIGATVNYKNGPAVISMIIDVKYNPEYETNPDQYDQWTVSSRLETRISF